MNDNNEKNTDQENSIGKIMLILALLLVLAMLTFFFKDVLDKQRNPNQQINNILNSEGIPEVVLQQNRQGHYFATGSINNQTVDFLLDTGATDVAIPAEIAKKLKLKPGPEVRMTTANGVITAQMTRLDNVELGGISLKNIRATINPFMHKDDEILLGMSFLKHLEMTQRGKTLILKPYYE